MKYCFGPVNSRRLGLSLGVDLMPHKTCTMNCIYCECGPTDRLTDEIREYTPTHEVIAELDGLLSNMARLDAVTFSGSGEPTLHCGIGTIVEHLKGHYPRQKVAVLTNGSLLWRPEVRTSILGADIVIPSLDAVSETAFREINRPVPDLGIGTIIGGLVDFRREFHGSMYVEIFIVPGINDTEEELSLLRDACMVIAPDGIQLNTLDRPGTESWVRAATAGELMRVRERLSPLQVEITGAPARQSAGERGTEEMILSTLKRRPSTMEDLQAMLGFSRDEVAGKIGDLAGRGLIVSEKGARGVYYMLSDRLRERIP